MIQLILAVTLVSYFPGENFPSDPRPNVVIIMADDLGYESLSLHGALNYHTPNLDSFFDESDEFHFAFAQPVCRPSRNKILRGQNTYRYWNAQTGLELPSGTYSIGNVMQDAGYATCIVGKWHLSSPPDPMKPGSVGFDTWMLYHLTEEQPPERHWGAVLHNDGEKMTLPDDEYGEDRCADYAIDWIAKQARNDKPFFLYYPMILPHGPFDKTPAQADRDPHPDRTFNELDYHDEHIVYMDEVVGRLFDSLVELGVWEETIVVFTADNGSHSGTFTQTESGRIPGGKATTTTLGIHVPMAVKSVEGWYPYCDRIFQLSDVMASLVHLTGGSETYQDGLSIFSSYDKTEAVSQWNIRTGTPHYDRRGRWVQGMRYKLYQNGEFYDWIRDPMHRKPLTDEAPEIRRRYREMLDSIGAEYPFR